MNRHTYDAIVLGGGTMGSAAALALARRGQRVVVIEQFGHVHDLGSHGGKTRIIRHAYAESPAYVPLVQRADELWRQIEDETGERIFVRCGGLEMAAPGHPHARAARASADEHGLSYEWLTPAQGRTRWPMVAIPDDWDVFFDPHAGFLMAEAALRSMMTIATSRGTTLHTDEPAVEWRATNAAVSVRTTRTIYEATRLIITAGAWASAVLSDLGLPLQVLRKTLWWLDVDSPERFAPERFPVFIADSEFGEIYGFPIIDKLGLKIADHGGGDPTDAETVNRTAADAESDHVRSLATQLFSGASDRIAHRAVCLYTMTPDGHFVVDRHPEHSNVVVACGFSGHGFKFAPAIGELVALLAEDPAARPPSILAIDRLLAAAR